MAVEYYTLEWDSKRLRVDKANEPLLLTKDEQPPAPWQRHSCLGDDNRVWCEVYRAPEQKGGVFVVRDFDETLLVATAHSNLDFVQGLDHFARLTSNARYAADIFEHNDDDSDE